MWSGWRGKNLITIEGFIWVDSLKIGCTNYNPYLVKDYKIVRDSLNEPLKDAQLSLQLFEAQCKALIELQTLIRL
jgi:hypothetical protein